MRGALGWDLFGLGWWGWIWRIGGLERIIVEACGLSKRGEEKEITG